MWVITTRGFYSAVAHREEPDRLIIRARCRSDIQALRDLLPDAEPYRLERSDYEWRLECWAAEWASAMAVMALEVDYPNFKDAVKERQGVRRAHILMHVWQALLGLERPGRFAEMYKGAFDQLPLTHGAPRRRRGKKGGKKARG